MSSKKTPRLSLRALAALAGVSVSTASRALHNHPMISEAVRKRIQALARRRGYEINPLVGQVFSEARAGRGFQHLGTLAYVTSYETADWWHGHPTLRGFHDGVVARAGRGQPHGRRSPVPVPVPVQLEQLLAPARHSTHTETE